MLMLMRPPINQCDRSACTDKVKIIGWHAPSIFHLPYCTVLYYCLYEQSTLTKHTHYQSRMNVEESSNQDASQEQQQDQQQQQPVIPKNSLVPALPRAAELLFANSTEEKKLYWDRSHYDSPESQMRALSMSSTLYIGNLAFSTRSCHVRSHFGLIGHVKSVQMGLDRFLKAPCGFCFVEYLHRDDAIQAVANLSGTKLDGKIIRVELDAGFQPGRQYGRGTSGGQVRDDRGAKNDPARKRPKQNLNWTPPDQVQQQEQQEQKQEQQTNANGPDLSYYGAGDKRERENESDGEADMGQGPEKNPRFRED
jgi:nuclear cap-binding protein subunit 2